MTLMLTQPSQPAAAVTSTAMSESQRPGVSGSEKFRLSPKDILLPPSPPANSEDDSAYPVRRPSRSKRSDGDSSISTKPIIHQLPERSRNLSPSTPLPRPHTSLGISMPLMQRAHSSPGVDSSGRFIAPGSSGPRRPASPLSAGRRRSPLRGPMEESYPASWSGLAIEPNIPEHAELDLSEEMSNLSPLPSYNNTFPRSRRRPTSPLHPSASAPVLNQRAELRSLSPHTAGTSSPHARYYLTEPYPWSFSSTSSMPSTPSSFRSRSPSISSLETIEDSPDAEEAARVAAEEDAKYRVDMGEGESSDRESRRRSSLEVRGSSLRSNKERKRWSVCGAERRADFSLEPIEE